MGEDYGSSTKTHKNLSNAIKIPFVTWIQLLWLQGKLVDQKPSLNKSGEKRDYQPSERIWKKKSWIRAKEVDLSVMSISECKLQFQI